MLKPHLRRLVAFAFVICLLGVPAAFTQIVTGNIIGKIVDAEGNPLPAVKITALSSATNLEREVRSNETGDFSILALPPGVYVVLPEAEAHNAPAQFVVVQLGQTAPVRFSMQPGAAITEVEPVTTAPQILNTTKTELGTIVTEEQIRSYPLINRDYTDLALFAPGERQAVGGQFDPTKKEGIYTPFTTGGTAGRNINFSIDGADNNDNVVGFFTQGFTAEAIREFEVVQDQYKAEYGRSLGGVVNVITKSGTNELSGSLFVTARNEDTRSKSFSERLANGEKIESDREQFGGSIGGPIVRDKLFYFLAFERQQEETPVTLSDTLTGNAGTEPPGFPFMIATPGTVVPIDFDRDLYTVRFDWYPSNNHQVWARFSSDDVEFLNDQGAGGALGLASGGGATLTDPSNQGNSETQAWSAVLNWQWILGNRWVNELKIHRNHYENRIVSSSPDPRLTLFYDSFSLGRNVSTPQATFQDKFQLRDDLSWIAGKHSFKTGIEVIRVELDDSLLGPQQHGLAFTFNSGVDVPGSFVSGDGNGNSIDDGIEAIDNIAFFSPGFIPGTEYTQYAAYFQDDWSPTPRWRLHLGLRVDHDDDIFADATQGPNNDFYRCFANPDDAFLCGLDPMSPAPVNAPNFVDFENTFPDDPTNIAPRLGFVYRVNGEDRDVIRGSWGLFYDKLIDNIVLFTMRQHLSPFFSPSLPSLSGVPDLTMGSTPVPGYAALPADFTLFNWENPASGLQGWVDGLASVQGQANFNDGFVVMPSPDWETPYNSAFSFGWGHTFTSNLALDTNLIYRRGFHQLFLQAFAGANSGRDAPFPVVVDPMTSIATYPGFVFFFTTEGKSEYVSLQTSLRGQFENFDFTWNINLSQAEGTQDTSGAFTAGGTIDVFDGGNITFTGGEVDSEFGRLSGDQALYTQFYGLYRFPRLFRLSGSLIYGTNMYFHPYAGVDINGDGFNDLTEYAGSRGGGLGDDLFTVNLRISKLFDTGRGTHIEAFMDVFNLFDTINHGIFVDHQQFVDVGGVTQINPDFGRPTGLTLTPPRTVQFGSRFTF